MSNKNNMVVQIASTEMDQFYIYYIHRQILEHWF